MCMKKGFKQKIVLNRQKNHFIIILFTIEKQFVNNYTICARNLLRLAKACAPVRDGMTSSCMRYLKMRALDVAKGKEDQYVDF